MSNMTLCCLLSLAMLLLMNQQATFVEAKPFLLPPNFFVLTTRAPCTSQRTTNCNSNGSSTTTTTGSSSSNGFNKNINFQVPDLITPKLRLLSTLLQSFMRAGSNAGAGNGGFGITINKFAGFRPAASTTTTTSSPIDTTEPDAVFKPDSTEDSSIETTSSSSTTSSSITTEKVTTTSGTEGPGNANEVPISTASTTTKPDSSYFYEQGISSGSFIATGAASKSPEGLVSSNVVLSGRLGESTSDNENTSNVAATPGAQDAAISTKGTKVSAGYQYGKDSRNDASVQSSGYQYGKPADNEVSK